VKIIGERRENLNSTLGQLPLRDSEGRTKRIGSRFGTGFIPITYACYLALLKVAKR
jgi:hypothetical protein